VYDAIAEDAESWWFVSRLAWSWSALDAPSC
jgi:hypothetical protein